jgi:hypothetical protein
MIVKFFSYFYHLLLSLVLVALSVVALISGGHNLQLEMLPWKEAQLTYSLLILGVCGLIAVVLAYKGILRLIFLIWSLVVLGFLFKGYIFSSYAFSGDGEFAKTLYFIGGAILACVGAWIAYREQPVKR